jgi:hypothetical protein
MIHCKNCIYWIDESFDQIEADPCRENHIFMGCRIFGNLDGTCEVERCDHFKESGNIYTICKTCGITVPKICVSFGECTNCTDTDLFCIDSCIGGDSRKYCTHFVRLHTEGIQLIDQDQVFDLFPNQPLPGKKKE